MVIDYYSVEGVEVVGPPTQAPDPPPSAPTDEVIRQLLRADERLGRVSQLRRDYLRSKSPGAFLVTSPIAVVELIERHAEAAFKQMVAESTGVLAIQRKDKKELGRLLQQLVTQRGEEHGALGSQADGPSALKDVVQATWLNAGFAHAHGLAGITVADLINFDVTEDLAYGVLSYFAYVQLGAADILHLLAAHHLGCDYFASFDSDFQRVKDDIQGGLHLTVLTTPDELLRTVRPIANGGL